MNRRRILYKSLSVHCEWNEERLRNGRGLGMQSVGGSKNVDRILVVVCHVTGMLQPFLYGLNRTV